MSAGTPRPINRSGESNYSKNSLVYNYQVANTALSDGPAAAVTAVAALAAPTGYILTRITHTHHDKDPLVFDVDVTYDKPINGATDPSPLLRPSILSGSWQALTESYFLGYPGSPGDGG